MRRSLALLVLLASPLVPAIPAAPALATAIGPGASNDSRLCHAAVSRIEREEGLPKGILEAIALAESGRWDPARRAASAWPWTVNAGGEAAYLASRAEAVAHVERLRAAGRTNIDVGCLQINLGWHPNAFPDLESAFDPLANATYAAAFLQTLREEAGSWEGAVERYHSRDPDRGRSYRERVWRIWAGLDGRPVEDEPPIRLALAAERARANPAPPASPPPMRPVRTAAVEVSALRAVARLQARATWRWLQLQAPMPSEFLPAPPAAVLAALDPAAAEPAEGALVPVAALGRPLVFAGPLRSPTGTAPGRIPGMILLRPQRASPAGRRARPTPTRAARRRLERARPCAYLPNMAKRTARIATEEGHLTGMLLIAVPGMPDPRFAKSVVYMCAHSPQGAMGLIVNQVAPALTLPKIVEQLGIRPEIDLSDCPVHVGGPVETGRGFVLHSPDYVQESTLVIDDRFALTATLDVLKAIAEGGGPRRRVFALGYAGWAPGQLDAEIQANGWLVAPADEDLVFGTDDAAKWHKAMARIGVDPAMFSTTAGRA